MVGGPGQVQRLHSTTDAQVWAQEFMHNIKAHKDWSPEFEKVVDEGFMISWFANAIETGKTHARSSSGCKVEEL